MKEGSCSFVPVSGPLHTAAQEGSERRVAALLTSGVDINQTSGLLNITPLIVAAQFGHTRIVRLLLRKGASVFYATTLGYTALHAAARWERLAVTNMLISAGADVEAKSIQGATPLSLAADEGHAEIMRALIEGGASFDCRSHDGATPLYRAAQDGHLEGVRVLLRAKANVWLACTPLVGANDMVPLEAAAQCGFNDVVRELIQHGAIRGPGGATRGTYALSRAAWNHHVDVVATLTDAGVADSGHALLNACIVGDEACVKLLLHQQQRKGKADPVKNFYTETTGPDGRTPLLESIDVGVNELCSPRIVRLLINAGANTTSAIRFSHTGGDGEITETPLDFTTRKLDDKKVDGEVATEEQLHRLEAVRRLLLQAKAVHAASWLWPKEAPAFACAGEGTQGTSTPSIPMWTMLPILRRRARNRRLLLAALSRYSSQKY